MRIPCTAKSPCRQCAAVTNVVPLTRTPEQSSLPLSVSTAIAPAYGCCPLSGDPPTTASAVALSASAAMAATPAARNLDFIITPSPVEPQYLLLCPRSVGTATPRSGGEQILHQAARDE